MRLGALAVEDPDRRRDQDHEDERDHDDDGVDRVDDLARPPLGVEEVAEAPRVALDQQLDHERRQEDVVDVQEDVVDVGRPALLAVAHRQRHLRRVAHVLGAERQARRVGVGQRAAHRHVGADGRRQREVGEDDDGVQHHDEDDRELNLHLLEPQPHPLAHGDLRRKRVGVMELLEGAGRGGVCRGMQNCAPRLGFLPIWEDDSRGPGDDHRRRCGALAEQSASN